MHLTRFLTTAAVAALLAGAAQAQTPTAPATKAPAQSPAAAPGAAAKVTPAGDIVETAKASGQFTTFLKAAEATNLTGLLKTNKNLTVFAPTDAAFAALPAGELEKLMLPENKAQLQKLMIYHIVNAPVTSADFKGSTRKAATVAGPSVELSGGEKPMVNDATIVQADVAASNGILHVVDKVLTPGAASATASGAAASTTAPETPATPPAAAAKPAATPKAAPPKDKLAALEAAQCLTQDNKEMAPSPVPPMEPDAKAAVKDEAATPPPAADQMGADAAAQEQTPPPAAEPAPTPEAVPPTSDATTPPATGAMTAPAATPGADASAAVTATAATVTMQPVADTPENRALYKPLSNAGKRSKAKGN